MIKHPRSLPASAQALTGDRRLPPPDGMMGWNERFSRFIARFPKI
jgi:hypothetical protein